MKSKFLNIKTFLGMSIDEILRLKQLIEGLASLLKDHKSQIFKVIGNLEK
jgi:hypothetical protein